MQVKSATGDPLSRLKIACLYTAGNFGKQAPNEWRAGVLELTRQIRHDRVGMPYHVSGHESVLDPWGDGGIDRRLGRFTSNRLRRFRGDESGEQEWQASDRRNRPHRTFRVPGFPRLSHRHPKAIVSVTCNGCCSRTSGIRWLCHQHRAGQPDGCRASVPASGGPRTGCSAAHSTALVARSIPVRRISITRRS